MTSPVPLVPASIQPFDLQAPARLLVPGPPHDRSGYSERSVTIDHYDGPVVLTVTRWGSCRQGCKAGPGGHDAGYGVRLRVPCPDRPHCNACECDSAHNLVLPPEKVAELKGILP